MTTGEGGPERLRLFVAVRVPAEVLSLLDARVEPIRSRLVNARWTTTESQHLTLKFLGSVSSDRVEMVTQTMRMVAASHEPGRVAFTELGAFPSKTRIRVLWMGIADAAGLLTGLARDLDRALEAVGFPSEARAYTPHLTLARFKLAVPLKGGFPVVEASGLPSFSIDELVLFRSLLSPRGARYEVMGVVPVGSPR